MQIYRQMTIGTAKPTQGEMQGIPHHLIDCVDPDEEYSVARFKEEALRRIEDILFRGRQPIVAGGTGLYINGLTMPWGFREKDTDEKVRERLAREVEEMGREAFYERLKAVDPVTAAALHPNNVKRMIRAYEIYEVTGKPKSCLDMEAAKEELPYDYVLMGISMERPLLYERINRRIDLMVRDGLIEEVKSLLDQGYTEELLSMKAIGYKEIFPYLKGEMSLEEALHILKRDTRHFAKRQLTWFRKDLRIRWFEVENYDTRVDMAEDMSVYFSVH